MAIIRPIQRAAASQVDDVAVRDLLKDAGFAFKNGQYAVGKSTLSLILKHIPGLKSKNVAFLNALTSLQEGLNSGDFTKKSFNDQLREEFTAYRLTVENMLTELSVPTQKDEMLSIEELLVHQRSTLTSFEQTRDELERKLLDGSGVVLAYAPVIPITQPGLDVAKLKANAFKAESFMGYPILHKMLVAGISTERILAEVAKGRGVVPSKRVFTDQSNAGAKASTPAERDEVTQRFIDTVIQKNKGQKLMVVGGSHQWYDATWFFLLPQAYVEHLKRCTLSPTTVQSLLFKKWSFPFANRTN